MEKVTFCCDVMYKNEKTGRLEIVDGVLVKNEVYTANIFKHPCPNSRSFFEVAGILKNRVICKERFDKDTILQKELGTSVYNIYGILRYTHGVSVDDHIWFKYEDENLSWDSVNPRG